VTPSPGLGISSLIKWRHYYHYVRTCNGRRATASAYARCTLCCTLCCTDCKT